MSRPPRRAVLDHLVVAAASLEEGREAMRRLLDVDMPFGGAHPRMGTHNLLAALGPDTFLEVIAVDPRGRPPARPRWFGLDEPDLQARLRDDPRLVSWVARVADLAGLGQDSLPFGEAAEMTRGNLSWQIAFPPSGAVAEGVLPALIEWPAGPHPAARMVDLGLKLEAFRIFHPEPARIRALLATIGAEVIGDIRARDEPGLEADLRRGDGKLVTLR